MPHLAKTLALPPAVAGEHISRGHDTRLELLLVLAVGANGGDMKPGVQPLRAQPRTARRRGGDDHLTLGNELGGVIHRLHLETEFGLHLRDIAVAVAGGLRMHQHAPEITHEAQAAHLPACLLARAEDPHRIDLQRREVARSQRTGEPRAQIREIAVVEKHGLQKPGFGAHQDHQPAA